MHLTIITVCLNNIEGLKKTFASLERQTIHDFDHLIVDGGSTDGTKEFLQNYQAKWTYKWTSEKDGGIYDAFNKGVARSTGEYIWFLNSGDSCADENVVAELLTAMDRSPKTDVFYGMAWFENEFGRRPVGSEITPDQLAYGMPINHQAVICRREIAKRYPFRTDFKVISDWITTRQIFESGAKTQFLNRFISVFDLSGISSLQLWKGLKEKIASENTNIRKAQMFGRLAPKIILILAAKKIGIYDAYKKRRYSYNYKVASDGPVKNGVS